MNLIERLDYSNLLGMDSNLKNGKWALMKLMVFYFLF
jgi:hypothetical protein